MMGTLTPSCASRSRIGATAAAASASLTVMRTSSEPARASALICCAVPSMSALSVLVIDCTTMGAGPPTVTRPIFTARVLRRGWLIRLLRLWINYRGGPGGHLPSIFAPRQHTGIHETHRALDALACRGDRDPPEHHGAVGEQLDAIDARVDRLVLEHARLHLADVLALGLAGAAKAAVLEIVGQQPFQARDVGVQCRREAVEDRGALRCRVTARRRSEWSREQQCDQWQQALHDVDRTHGLTT